MRIMRGGRVPGMTLRFPRLHMTLLTIHPAGPGATEAPNSPPNQKALHGNS